MAREAARVLRALREFIQDEMGRLQLRTYQTLTLATPVDTGFARGAWTPSVGVPFGGGGTPPRGRAAAEAAGSANLAKNRAKAEQIARAYNLANGDVFISNNTAYIGRLNDGTSAQAPPRFIEQAVARAVRGR